MFKEIKDNLEERVERALAKPVDFGQLSGNLFSGIVLKDLVIYNQEPANNQTYFIKADLVTIFVV